MSGDLPATSFDSAAAHVGTGVALTGSGAAIVGGFTVSDWGVIVGIFTAILGLVIQFWFKWREDQRQERYWAERLNHDDEESRETLR